MRKVIIGYIFASADKLGRFADAEPGDVISNPDAEPASRAELVAALRRIDQDYDDTDLSKMTDAFLSEIKNDTKIADRN